MLCACQQLLVRIPVAIPERHVFLLFLPTASYILILQIPCHPAVCNAQVINRVMEEPLHMKAVIREIKDQCKNLLVRLYY